MQRQQAEIEKLEIFPAAYTNGNTAASTVDTLGGDSIKIRVAISLGATATIASSDGTIVRLASSDVTHTSSFSTLVADQSGIKTSKQVVYHVNPATGKRYLRVSVIPGTSGVSNEVATVAVFSTLGRLEEGPSNTTAMMTGNTNDAFVIA